MNPGIPTIEPRESMTCIMIDWQSTQWKKYNTWWASNEGLNEHPGGSTSTAGIREDADFCQSPKWETDQCLYQEKRPAI